MVERAHGIPQKRLIILELGKKGNTTLREVADAWDIKETFTVLRLLHNLQELKGFAYLVDGEGRFRIFKDFGPQE